MIGLLMDQQMIEYSKHLSSQGNDTYFRSPSRLDSQEELFEPCVSRRPNNSMRYFNDHAFIDRDAGKITIAAHVYTFNIRFCFII